MGYFELIILYVVMSTFVCMTPGGVADVEPQLPALCLRQVDGAGIADHDNDSNDDHETCELTCGY